jgi:hypothetical protein
MPKAQARVRARTRSAQPGEITTATMTAAMRAARPKLVRRLGLLGLSAFALTLTLTACASTVTSPAGAGVPLVATTTAPTDTATSQPTTIDLSSPSQAAPTTAAPSTAAPATTAPPKPRAVTTTVKAKPSLCGAPSNPFGYNFCHRGGYVHSPAATVCSYFNCIAYFQNGKGYMVECKDYTYSMSGGISGACSHHKGVLRPVYSG